MGKRVNEREIVLIIENSTMEIKKLIQSSFIELIPIKDVKNNVLLIIDKCYNEIKAYDNFAELAEKTRVSQLENFNKWYSEAYVALKLASKDNRFIDLILKALTESNETLASNKANIGAYVIGSDGLIVGKVDTQELRKYMSTGKSGYSQMLINNYTELVNKEMIKISDSRPTLKDKLGRDMSLRNLAEMEVRYNKRNEVLSDLKSNGNKLVMISQHNNASQRCAPWQGRVYSLDGSSGFTNDKNHYKYEPLENATANHQLFGYNCRHRAFAYIENMDKPKPVSSEEIKKERAIEFNKRNYEREIRRVESRKKLAIDDKEVSEYKTISKQLKSKYKNYCKVNDTVYEEWRTEV